MGMNEPLSRGEFLRIARGEDPKRRPIWNGMPRMTTPPQAPTRPMEDEGQLFEFLFPYPINIFDDAEWPALLVRRDNIHLNLLKPISLQVLPRESVAAGNEAPDLFSTNFRVLVLRTSTGYPAKHSDVFTIVREALQWIRVLSRQYWIGTGTAGVAAAYRGSSFRVEVPAVTQMNFAAYGQTVVVRPFDVESWRQVSSCVEAQLPVPPAESIFCDALSSFASGDVVRSVIELGVSAEIEVSNLLDDVTELTPHTPAAQNYIKSKRNLSFETRLTDTAKSLGLEDPHTFSPPGMQSTWAKLLIQLYKFRNKAAHEGRCSIWDVGLSALRPLNSGELQSFIFATEALYRWAREQRAKLGLATAATPRREGQIVSIIGGIGEGGLVLATSEASCPTT